VSRGPMAKLLLLFQQPTEAPIQISNSTPTPPTFTLPGGAEMPRIGLGTWPMDNDEAERAVTEAIDAGYRLFDTAENYRNEEGVGGALRASGVPRDQLWVTSKFNREWHGVDLVRDAVEQSLQRLGLDYIDLMLIHWPNPEHGRYVEAWQGLVRLREAGLLRAIGVSNFKPAHLEQIREQVGVMPEVNQVQLNPFITRADARQYHAEHGVITQSWAPLSKGHERLLEEPAVTALAERYGKTPAQVVLRWHLELGLTAVPKSANPQRLRENLNVFDFALVPGEVDAITALDGTGGTPADSDKFGH
jgi:2,5-diketo-D-gluconate reductase A